jgi:cytochrome P460
MDRPSAREPSAHEAPLRRVAILLSAVAALAGATVWFAPPSRSQEATPVFVKQIPPGYRDWTLISVAREEGPLDDVRAVLGNDAAIKAYREKKPFPDGAIIARIAWSLDASEENDKVFSQFFGHPVDRQSFVAGAPKNGVQFMVKDSKRYAATGGWGYAQFDNGKSADESILKTCHPCHAAISERDSVFTRYAP